MVKKRLFKIGTIQWNMLTRGLQELPQAAGPDEREYRWAVLALNGLRDSYLAAGRSSGGIDKVLLGLLRSKYKKVRD